MLYFKLVLFLYVSLCLSKKQIQKRTQKVQYHIKSNLLSTSVLQWWYFIIKRKHLNIYFLIHPNANFHLVTLRSQYPFKKVSSTVFKQLFPHCFLVFRIQEYFDIMTFFFFFLCLRSTSRISWTFLYFRRVQQKTEILTIR